MASKKKSDMKETERRQTESYAQNDRKRRKVDKKKINTSRSLKILSQPSVPATHAIMKPKIDALMTTRFDRLTDYEWMTTK